MTTTSNNSGGGANGSVGTAGSISRNDPAALVYQQGGTSLSAAITAGSFALVASALDYWAALTPTGATTDAYLAQPVGVHALNFGPHVLTDLNAYANPDGINSILQWTSVPTLDNPATFDDTTTTTTGGTTTTTSATPHLLLHSNQARAYSRIDVGNAIAAIEGTIALNYLFKNNDMALIDTNHNGLITAQEIQNFVDSSATAGLPEAGAMARLLGGTARIPGSGTTGVGQTPDQPDVLQRRFNFFDYAANGSLKGVVSIAALKQLSTKLLPQPGDFTIIDRQRSSAIRYLLSPQTVRATQDLQYLKPNAVFIPASKVQKYANFTPARFGVGRNINPLTAGPAISLYDGPTPTHSAVVKKAAPVAAIAAAPAPTAIVTETTPAPTVTVVPPKLTVPTSQAGIVQAIQAIIANQKPAVATPPTTAAAQTGTATAKPATATTTATTATATAPLASTAGVVGSNSASVYTPSKVVVPNVGANALNPPTPAGSLPPAPLSRAARIAAHQAKVEAYHVKLAAFHALHPNANKPKPENAFQKFFNNLGIPLFKKKTK